MSWMLSKGSKLTCINPPQWRQKTHLFASRSGNVGGGVLSLWEAMFRVAWFKRLTTLRLGHIEPPEGEQSKSHSSSLASSFSSFSSSLSSSLRKRSFESSMVHEFQLVSASHRHSHQGEEHCDVEIDWRARTNAKYYWLLHITQLNLPCTTYNRTWWTTKKQAMRIAGFAKPNFANGDPKPNCKSPDVEIPKSLEIFQSSLSLSLHLPTKKKQPPDHRRWKITSSFGHWNSTSCCAVLLLSLRLGFSLFLGSSRSLLLLNLLQSCGQLLFQNGKEITFAQALPGSPTKPN